MKKLDEFVLRVKDFDTQQSSNQIDYFALYFEVEEGILSYNAKELKACFSHLKIQEYSNVNAYLITNSQRGRKPLKFLKKNGGYHLENNYKKILLANIGHIPEPVASDKLFPLVLFENTRGYLQKVAKQASVCYDMQQFDASFVMIRKLLEILIIECFERHSIDSKIKDRNGDFFYLSDLITHLLSETKWNITRNTRQALPRIKKFADMSAHNRRFIASKPDIESIKDDLRVSIEEFLHLIDYKTWTTK